MITGSGKFTVGGLVRVRTGATDYHCRTPDFLKGKDGVVEFIVGKYPNPEQLAYHKPGLPKRELYQVRFKQDDIWPCYKGSDDDAIIADIYEDWLEQTPQETYHD